MKTFPWLHERPEGPRKPVIPPMPSASEVAARMPLPAPGPQGDKGDTGDAVVAISAGVRKLTVTRSGVLAGETVVLKPTAPIPTGFAIHDVYAPSANTLEISLTAPLLSIGASYSIGLRAIALR